MIYPVVLLHCTSLLVNGENSANALCNLNNQEVEALKANRSDACKLEELANYTVASYTEPKPLPFPR